MKKSKILASATALALAGTMSFALVGCGGGKTEAPANDNAPAATANNYNEIAEKVKAEEAAHVEEAKEANSDVTAVAAPGDAIKVNDADGDYTIVIDAAYIAENLKYADGDVACKLYYTITNESRSDSEIDLREVMLVEDATGEALQAEPDARPSEDVGRTSAPLSIADCEQGKTVGFATHYGVPAGTGSITVTINGTRVSVPLEAFAG